MWFLQIHLNIAFLKASLEVEKNMIKCDKYHFILILPSIAVTLNQGWLRGRGNAWRHFGVTNGGEGAVGGDQQWCLPSCQAQLSPHNQEGVTPNVSHVQAEKPSRS